MGVKAQIAPVLSWSMFDDSLEFVLKEMPGVKCPVIKVTSVGQVAAVDIVWRAGVLLPQSITKPPIDTRLYHIGSPHPAASTHIVMPLSQEERGW